MITAAEIQGARVLIVDDQEVNVLLLERVLRGAGHRCVSSTREPTRVSALHRENNYDLILLDLEMPRMNGFQVMESLKEAQQ
jgi:CheY-like chemotaxis protein